MSGGTNPMQAVLIPGNIRQQYLPFVLKPDSNLNANIKDNRDLTDGPQFFSFRNKKADQYKAGFGRLNICPSVMRSPEFGLYFNKDISNKLLYDYDSKDPITIDSFFNQLPGIQIREFQVDSKLDQFINLFFELFQSAKGLFKEFKLSDLVGVGNTAARSRWFDMIGEVLTTCWDYCTGQGKFINGPNMFFKDDDGTSRWSLEGAVDKALSGLKSAVANNLSPSMNLDTYLMDFPFQMYYRLQSCTSTNIYELPYIGDQIWSTDGNDGWKDADFGLKDLTGGGKEQGMAGKILNMITGFGDTIDRIRINYMPKWDPTGGGKCDSIAIQFDLFNDTAEAALKNFIFVNTIVPNNLWMQYGMFKHSPCLYDVKIEGLKRMFLCSGNFSVKSNGLLRTPSPKWIQDLCQKHANDGGGGKIAGCWDAQAFINDIIDHNLIKIPDVYTVEMTFTSLIPSNFNTFLFNYSKNSKIELYTNNEAHIPSVVGDALRSIKTDLNDEIKKVTDKGNTEIANIRAEEEKNNKKNGGGNSVLK